MDTFNCTHHYLYEVFEDETYRLSGFYDVPLAKRIVCHEVCSVLQYQVILMTKKYGVINQSILMIQKYVDINQSILMIQKYVDIINQY